MHEDNRKNNILVFGEGPTNELHAATITEEIKDSITFTKSRKIVCLSINYNERNSFLYASGVKIYQFKVKCPLCEGNMKKKTGLYGYVYDFPVDLNTIHISDVGDIDMCLMKKHDMI